MSSTDVSGFHTITPDIDVDDFIDVFAVGKVSALRWRSYLDITDEGRHHPSLVPPEEVHNRLLERRAYHARNTYEYWLLADMAKGWQIHHAVLFFAELSVLELRCVEVEIAGFQLTCGMVYIKCGKELRRELYTAALLAYATHLLLFDMVCSDRGVKKGRKEVMKMAPSLTSKHTDLADCVDKNLHAVQMLIKHGLVSLYQGLETDAASVVVTKVHKKLTEMVKALDNVLVVAAVAAAAE